MRRVLIAVLALACLLAAAPAAQAAVPRGFWGMNVNGPLDDRAFPLDAEAQRMKAAGVRSWRVEFSWDLVQPGPSTYDWAASDRKVLAAARAGIDVLGLIARAPAWATGAFNPWTPPKQAGDYGGFARTLVERYGPKGTLWAANPSVPKRPVRDWEIWNEPNLKYYFDVKGSFAAPYAKLLRAASAAIRKADKGATVVLAGMANFSWRDLATLLRTQKRLDFDDAAVHPFTGKPSGMIEIVRRNRAALDRYGHRKASLWLTELTWSSAKGRKEPLTKGWETTEAGQAERLTQAFTLLAKHRRSLRIGHVHWYTWATSDDGSPNSFDYSGLRTTRGAAPGQLVDKPAMAAYRAIVRKLR